jgi:hypothetical protein
MRPMDTLVSVFRPEAMTKAFRDGSFLFRGTPIFNEVKRMLEDFCS